ncbi:MAG: hypothetical protein KKE04_02750 [Candidatus Thermoplasmatota archaeon]|nr:hypothetical protein [Candidatus Thermoplasmatota archaeon]
MMDKRFVAGFAVIGIVVLYLVSAVSQPENMGLEETKSMEGEKVVTEGIVSDKYQTNSGNTILGVKNDNATVSVFLEGKTNAEIGDEIRVTGIIQEYRDENWIMASDIEILKKWDENYIELKQLKSNLEKYEGTNINVTGFAVSIKHNEFYLSDNISKIKIKIIKSTVLPMENQKIFVKGKMEYDENRFEYFIKLEMYGVINE